MSPRPSAGSQRPHASQHRLRSRPGASATVLAALLVSAGISGATTEPPQEQTMRPATTSTSLGRSGSLPQQPQAPTTQDQATGPAAPGVVLSLEESVESLHASGRLSAVLDSLADPLKQAASTCGTTITAVEPAGGGLLVHLADPGLNACLAREASNLPHVVSADEDMHVGSH